MSIQMLLAGGAKAPRYVEDMFTVENHRGTSTDKTIFADKQLSGKSWLAFVIERYGAIPRFITSNWSNGAAYLTGGMSSVIGYSNTGVAAGGVGYKLAGGEIGVNEAGSIYGSWLFQEDKKFFKQNVINHVNGAADTVDLSSLGELGMVWLKNGSTNSLWNIWHRTYGLLGVNTPNRSFSSGGATTTNNYIQITGTTLTIPAEAPTGYYQYFAFAHDSAADGLIYCDTYTGSGAGGASSPSVTLGWEPQAVIVMRSNPASGDMGVYLIDDVRGLGWHRNEITDAAPNNGTVSEQGISPTPTGFIVNTTSSKTNAASQAYLFMAIRRGPMRAPTNGLSVFKPSTFTGTTFEESVPPGGAGFKPDMVWTKDYNNYNGTKWMTRPRGRTAALSFGENLFEAAFNSILAFERNSVLFNTQSSSEFSTGKTIQQLFFQRAKGFLDIVNFRGTGAARNQAHGLGVIPELIMVRARDYGPGGYMPRIMCRYPGASDTQAIDINNNSGIITSENWWDTGGVSASTFSLGDSLNTNGSNYYYEALLFASLLGVSKIGTYPGPASGNIDVDCGFSNGARFIMITRLDVAGGTFLWDSATGIISGAEPYNQINQAGPLITGSDYIAPNPAGFTITTTAPAALRASGGTFLFLAIA